MSVFTGGQPVHREGLEKFERREAFSDLKLLSGKDYAFKIKKIEYGWRTKKWSRKIDYNENAIGTDSDCTILMLALPVSRYTLSIAKFCVLVFYLFMEMAVFFAVFVVAGLIATHTMEITETLPVLYLLKWCAGLFLIMLSCIATMWAITVLFEKPLLSVGMNLLLVIPVPAMCDIGF